MRLDELNKAYNKLQAENKEQDIIISALKENLRQLRAYLIAVEDADDNKIRKLQSENKALKESRDELLFFLKGIQGELPKYRRDKSGEVIQKAEAQKEKETK